MLLTNPDEYDAGLPTFSEIIISQSKDDFYEKSRRLAATPGSAFTFDNNEIFVRRGSIDCPIQKLVPTTLRPRLLQ